VLFPHDIVYCLMGPVVLLDVVGVDCWCCVGFAKYVCIVRWDSLMLNLQLWDVVTSRDYVPRGCFRKASELGHNGAYVVVNSGDMYGGETV
jgi:hypothetical protein